MISVQIVPGAWYSDLTLSGEYCSLFRDSHVELNGVRIELPNNDNILFLRVTNYKGITYIAGQGSNSGALWIWDSVSKQWWNAGTTFGTNVCAFDNSGNLFVVIGFNRYRIYNVIEGWISPDIPLAIGSQGIRYTNSLGQPVTGDSTYGPSPYNLAQFTDLGNIIVDDKKPPVRLVLGQSYVSGYIAQLDKRYMLQPGDDCAIGHSYLDIDKNLLAVVIVHENKDPNLERAVFYWMDVSDLSQFPLEPSVVIPPKFPDPGPIVLPTLPPSKPKEPPTVPAPIKETLSKIQELKLMEPETVSLVCFDYYGRVLDGKVVFDQPAESEHTKFIISKPDDRFAIVPAKFPDKFLGADATSYGTDICKQFYLSDSRGNYESWFVGVRPSGLIEATIEYIQQGVNHTVPFASAVLTIKRKK